MFCSFLALVLRQELQARLVEHGHMLEWADVIQDMDRLQRVEVEQDGKRFGWSRRCARCGAGAFGGNRKVVAGDGRLLRREKDARDYVQGHHEEERPEHGARKLVSF